MVTRIVRQSVLGMPVRRPWTVRAAETLQTAGTGEARAGVNSGRLGAALRHVFPHRRELGYLFKAQRIQTLLTDDLNGSEAAGTVRFGLDGTEYEIDLGAADGDELRKALGL
jgi:hypothetical protein